MFPQETDVTRGEGLGWRLELEQGNIYKIWTDRNVEYYYAEGQYFIYMKVSTRFMCDSGGHYQNSYKVLHPVLLLEAVAGL